MHKIIFYGFEFHSGEDFKLDIHDSEGERLYSDINMEPLEQGGTIYSYDLYTLPQVLPLGVYTVRIHYDDVVVTHKQLIWDGLKEITLADLTGDASGLGLSEDNIKELRDALGLSGAKKLAKGGQLQKKSEYPYNNTVDSTDIIE